MLGAGSAVTQQIPANWRQGATPAACSHYANRPSLAVSLSLAAVGSDTAIGGVLMVVGGTGFTAIEFPFIGEALAALKAAVAVFTGTTDKSTRGHDGSPLK